MPNMTPSHPNNTYATNKQLLEPYQSTELRTHQLRRIHAAHDLLKKVGRFSATLARLRRGPLQQGAGAGAGTGSGAGVVGGLDPRELAKAAEYLQELEALVQVGPCRRRVPSLVDCREWVLLTLGSWSFLQPYIRTRP